MQTSGLRQLNTNCAHCNSLFVANPGQVYCCSGCEYVHGLLQDQGLDNFYRLRDANPPICPAPVQASTETYEYCDDPLFIQKVSRNGLGISFYLEGMNCTACLWLLERLPQLCSDAQTARLNMAHSTLTVDRIEGGSFAAIARTLNRLGYRPHVLEDDKSRASAAVLRKSENRRDLIRIGVAAACTGNIMILAVSLYGGAQGLLAEYFRWIASALAFPALTYCAWPFYKSTLASIRSRHLNIDVPIVAAIVAGIIFSIWSLSQGHDAIYFDSLSMLVFLLLSSRFLHKRIQQTHLDTSNLEDYLLFGTVRRVSESGQLESVSSISLKKGDVIEIQGEMSIPADGEAVKGHGIIHTAVLTGEATPITLHHGMRIEAGSRNLGGFWLMRVENPPSESRLARILKDTEESSRSKPELVRFADKVAQWFIGVVFLIAIGLAASFAVSDAREGISRALALIIVTCPCVFGMAIPLSMSLAIRAAARRGIVIKNSEVVERLTKIKALYFDKTGTLTKGSLSLVSFDVVGKSTDLAAALAIEIDQPHPVARVLVKDLSTRSLPVRRATDIQLLSEGGISGSVDGVTYSIRPLVGDSSRSNEASLQALYAIYRGQTLVATFEVGDALRPETKGLIEWTKKQGLKAHLLSGDQQTTVANCAAQLGLDPALVVARATPELKASTLKSSKIPSAMVGDGANDAAALAASHVGIAVRGSMDVSLRAADVYLTRTDLSAIPTLFSIAKSTRRAIIRNLAFSVSFNVIAGALAIAGAMTPLLAAILMPLSSLTVLLSALATGKRQ